MAYKCDITGKGKQFGHNVSHSQRKTQKVFKPNLQTKTLVIDGQKVRLKLAASTIRTLKRYQKQFDEAEIAQAKPEVKEETKQKAIPKKAAKKPKTSKKT
ncbi:MAG: 50S ribosomal protein L28 [bacterium]|nr:50S ribosomal protein L28 [bacterium]